MGLPVCPVGSGPRRYALGFVVWVLIFFQFQSVATAENELGANVSHFCARAIFVAPSNEAFQNYELAVNPQLYTDAASVVGEMVQHCPSPAACSKEEVAETAERAIELKGGSSRSLLRRLMLLPRRALVFLFWGGSVLGPGILSYYLTSGLATEVRIPLSNFVMQMSKDLFERFNGPVKDKLAPKVHQLAFWLWDPHAEDGWAQIHKRLNEASRLENSQIYNQAVLIRDDFKSAAKALLDGNIEVSAGHYMDAFLDSDDLFGGLNLDRRTTVRAARRPLRGRSIPSELRERVRDRVVEMISQLDDKELADPAKRGELMKSARRIVSIWIGM